VTVYIVNDMSKYQQCTLIDIERLVVYTVGIYSYIVFLTINVGAACFDVSTLKSILLRCKTFFW
jgi:hypothetical protein